MAGFAFQGLRSSMSDPRRSFDRPRQRARDIARDEWIAHVPGLWLGPVDDAALGAAARWERGRRAKPDWDWRYWASKLASDPPAFDMAFWIREEGGGAALHALLVGSGDPSATIRLKYLESYPWPENPLRGNAIRIMLAAVEAYADILGSPAIEVPEAYGPTVKLYSHQGFRLRNPGDAVRIEQGQMDDYYYLVKEFEW
jgi:hypothetical protein